MISLLEFWTPKPYMRFSALPYVPPAPPIRWAVPIMKYFIWQFLQCPITSSPWDLTNLLFYPILLWYILILSSVSQLLSQSGRFLSQGFDRNFVPVITLCKSFWKCVGTETLVFHWHEFWSLTVRKEGRPSIGLLEDGCRGVDLYSKQNIFSATK